MTDSNLSGLRILCVEDECIVAMLIEDILAEEGCEIVGPFAKLAPAIAIARSARIDGAVLDVNLNGETSYQLAELLAGMQVPYIFVTGYGDEGIAELHRRTRVVQKPFKGSELVSALAGMIATST